MSLYNKLFCMYGRVHDDQCDLSWLCLSEPRFILCFRIQGFCTSFGIFGRSTGFRRHSCRARFYPECHGNIARSDLFFSHGCFTLAQNPGEKIERDSRMLCQSAQQFVPSTPSLLSPSKQTSMAYRTVYLVKNQFLALKGNRRIALLIIYLCLITWWPCYENIRKACVLMNYRVTPWVYPIFSSVYYRQLLAGSILLFADAPFLSGNSVDEILRCGKKAFFASRMVFIFACSFLYFIFTVLLSLIFCVPNLYFSFDWGKLIHLTSTDYMMANSAGVGFMAFASPIVQNLSPLQAMKICTVISLLEYLMVALLIFLISLLVGEKNKAYGGLIAFIVALSPEFLQAFGDPLWGKYFPARRS